MKTFAEMMLGRDSGHRWQMVLSLLGLPSEDNEAAPDAEREIACCVVRRSIVKGAAAFWWKCHLPSKNSPTKWFQMLDPTTEQEAKETLFADLTGHPCKNCLGPYASGLQEWALRRLAKESAEV